LSTVKVPYPISDPQNIFLNLSALSFIISGGGFSLPLPPPVSLRKGNYKFIDLDFTSRVSTLVVTSPFPTLVEKSLACP